MQTAVPNGYCFRMCSRNSLTVFLLLCTRILKSYFAKPIFNVIRALSKLRLLFPRETNKLFLTPKPKNSCSGSQVFLLLATTTKVFFNFDFGPFLRVNFGAARRDRRQSSAFLYSKSVCETQRFFVFQSSIVAAVQDWQSFSNRQIIPNYGSKLRSQAVQKSVGPKFSGAEIREKHVFL